MPSPLIHVVGLDVQLGIEDEFIRWYDTEHLPTLLKRPGWSGARRYECLEGEPRCLTIFTVGEEALSERMSATPFGDPAFGNQVRDYAARTWRRIFSLGEDPLSADLINLITVDIEPDHAAAFSRWYNEVHVPEIVACPGWLGGSRYESLDGDPRFMAIYGLEDELRPFTSEEHGAVVGWDEHVDQIRGYHGFRIYRLVEEIGG
ncbi:MAG: hypothetical protein ACR2N5_07230 [Solirubrobacterales bacterium]